MVVIDTFRSLWHYWCRLWHLDWEQHGCLDRHKWENQTEVRGRLAGAEP